MAKTTSRDNQNRFRVKLSRSRKAQSGKGEFRAASSFLQKMQRLHFLSSSARGSFAGRGPFVRSPFKTAQRVVVKARVVRHVGSQKKALLKAHVTYITRDSAGINTELSPRLYDQKGELQKPQLDAFIEKTTKDRHHFRFIVSPENARELELSSYVGELINQMEKDLGTKLEYVAANHFNTDNPHAHLIVRAKDEGGKDLVISRDYLSHGVRNRACDIATRELGHRSQIEIRAGMTRLTSQQRFTQIDSDLIATQKKSGLDMIDTRLKKKHERSFEAFRRSIQITRLNELEKLHLASEVSPGLWKLDPQLETTLKALGAKNDIIKTMHEAMGKEVISEKLIFDPQNVHQGKITGSVVKKGLSDELYDNKYMVVSTLDNHAYYVPLSKYSEPPGFESKVGSIVSVTVKGRGGIGNDERKFVRIKLESYQGLEEQVNVNAPTWLDKNIGRTLVAVPEGLKSTFVDSFEKAKKERMQHLYDLNAVHVSSDGEPRIDTDKLYKLQMKEAVERYSQSHGNPVELQNGQSFAGNLRQIDHLPSGTHLVIGDGKSFVAVPFQKGMERLGGETSMLQVTNNTDRSVTVLQLPTGPKKAQSLEI